MLMIGNNFSYVCTFSRWRGSCVLTWRNIMLMTIIRLLMRSLRRRTVVRNSILSLKLFIFIVFINRFFLNCMIPNSMTCSRLLFLLSIFPNWRLLISLWRCNCGNLALMHPRALRNNTLSIFLIYHMRLTLGDHLWLLWLFLCVIIALSIVSSKVRSYAHRFIIWLSCFLSCSILLSRLLRDSSLATICWR